MHILGLNGSPRKKGNTHDLLTMFMQEAGTYGATTEIITVQKQDIEPCRELIVCEKKGFCPIKDDMDRFIYRQIKNADIIVLAAPVFFYNVPAGIKALIDRCQLFWARKYKLGLLDPNAMGRKGFLLSCGASGGKRLFEGVELTAKIFFDALSVKYCGALTYRHIENPGQIASHFSVKPDIQKAVNNLFSTFLSKKKILFVSLQDALRSQMAAAFFKQYTNGEYLTFTAGTQPLGEIHPETVDVMAEKQLDLKYLTPELLDDVTKNRGYDRVVFLGKPAEDLDIDAAASTVWEVDSPQEMTGTRLKEIRDDIEARVRKVVS